MQAVAMAALLAFGLASRPFVSLWGAGKYQSNLRQAGVTESGFAFLFENVPVLDDAEEISGELATHPCSTFRLAHQHAGFEFSGELASLFIRQNRYAIPALNPVPHKCIIYGSTHRAWNEPPIIVLELNEPRRSSSVVLETEAEWEYGGSFRDQDKQPRAFCSYQGIRTHFRCLRANVRGVGRPPRFMERILHRPPLPLHNVRLVAHGSDALFRRFGVYFRGQSIAGCDMRLAHGNFQPPAHMSRLSAHRYELQNSNDHETSSEPSNPPIGRRFISGLTSGVVCYLLCDSDLWRRGRRWKRRLRSTGIGSLFAGYVVSMLLLGLTGFVWTWDWWW